MMTYDKTREKWKLIRGCKLMPEDFFREKAFPAVNYLLNK